MRRRVVLLSGGVDSALCAFEIAQKEEAVCLFVDYGQPAAKQEYEACREFTQELRASGRSVLFYDAKTNLHYDDWSTETTNEIPARNLVLISMGINLALAVGADIVALGIIKDDAVDYVDCSPQFLKAAHELGAAFGVMVEFPLLKWKKRQVMQSAQRLGIDIDRLWSCYTPKSGKPCGECQSCKARGV
jgi:7-cyano-7-deazaguanine synthase